MALGPCDVHGTRYRGAAQHMYAAVLSGTDSKRLHIRLCESCASGIIERLEEISKPPTADGVYEPLVPDTCAICSGPVGPGDITTFLTAFLKGDDRKDFYFRWHLECVGVVQPFGLVIAA